MNKVTLGEIEAARSAAIAASDTARQWAAVYADRRCQLAALLVASGVPGAASLVFERDEDTLTAETIIRLVNIRDSNGALLWYNDDTGFAEDPDARALGEPPGLDSGALSDIECQIEAAYDTHAGHFDTTSDGAEVMRGANLLQLPVPFHPRSEAPPPE